MYLIGGIQQQVEANKLDNVNKRYIVDGRYKIIVDLPKTVDNVSVTCTLNSQPSQKISKIIESGEGLALISFYLKKTKLSIGVEEGRPGTVCEYLDNGINVIISNNADMNNVEFYVAWLTMQDEEDEDIFTWFAADPTLL
ncbi:hypothetical protein [Lacrimispora sp.]|uniref:hypothetical protein n=1 Tax=Lacrimispora sp. TaxID=2719234 RepID=UPI00345FE8A7